MKFTKMQGIGNDYIYLDCINNPIPADPAALSRRISDRHFGVGSDGLVLICPSERADFRMRMYNADGSESEMCGNATRCIGKYVYERGMTQKRNVSLETGAGIRHLKLNVEGSQVASVEVDMGEPGLNPEDIPTSLATDHLLDKSGRIISEPLLIEGREFRVTCVSMGNPHCVIFLNETENWPIEKWGPKFEHHAVFPNRTNTEFAKVIDRQHIRMRVWERGSGETMACGTGACATLAAGVLNGLTDREAILQLNGGDLSIRWDEKNNHIYMTGPAAFVFSGEWPE